MVISASVGREISQLIAALADDDDVRRESAIARLSVVGRRALHRLLAAYDAAAERQTKISVLRVLESIDDRRTILLARRALDDRGDVAAAATTVLRALVDSADRRTATEALDTLIAVVLDDARERRVRLAAQDSLHGLPDDIRAPLAKALEARSDSTKGPAVPRSIDDHGVAAAIWQDALEGLLPDRPAPLRALVQEAGRTTPLGAMKALVDQVRAREASTRPTAARAEWRALRGALHQALALRGSRIALYDLRETLADTKEPLAAPFLAALHAAGDASCLEPLAAAYARAKRSDERWRHQLGEAFRAIAARHRVTRRHTAMRRVVARWPDAARDLMGAG